MKNGKNHFGLKIGQFISTLRTTLSQGEIFASSIIIAYYILFSIFPIIIIIGNVLPLFHIDTCLLYTSPSARDLSTSRMPSSA